MVSTAALVQLAVSLYATDSCLALRADKAPIQAQPFSVGD
jgi:hypothetical protein